MNISGIVIEGVLVPGAKIEELVKLIEDNAVAAQNSCFMKYHCIVHQENLFTKGLRMDNIMLIIIKTEFYKNHATESSPISGIP